MAVDYPGAIDFPAHFTNVLGPPKNVPKGWVLHTPEEPADGHPGTPNWFATPNVGGSTHYFVSYLGFVFQCVREEQGAIANGVTPPYPYPSWANSSISLNRQSLSVEIEGYAASIAQTISPAQRTALLNLIRHRCQAHGIPMDRQHIIGHYQVASNRSDPGNLDIDAIVAELQGGEVPSQAEWDAHVKAGDTRSRQIEQLSKDLAVISKQLNDFISITHARHQEDIFNADTKHDERLTALEAQAPTTHKHETGPPV